MWNLLLDTHHYEIFDNSQVSMSIDDHIKAACDFGNQMASTGKWTIAGEWTGGITDCAKWLNGKNKGARYDGTFNGASKIGDCTGKYTGSVSGLSNDDKHNIGRFIEAQLDAYEKATGWIFWTWKNEGAPEWNMQQLLAGGLFPQPLTSRKCKFSPLAMQLRYMASRLTVCRSWPVRLNKTNFGHSSSTATSLFCGSSDAYLKPSHWSSSSLLFVSDIRSPSSSRPRFFVFVLASLHTFLFEPCRPRSNDFTNLLQKDTPLCSLVRSRRLHRPCNTIASCISAISETIRM